MKSQAKQLVLGTLAGGVIIYAVHAVAWAAWMSGTFGDLRAPEAIEAIAADAAAVPGTYFVNATEDHAGVGPTLWGWMTIHAPGDYGLGGTLIGSLGVNLGVAFLTSWVLLWVTGGYVRRALVAGAVGAAIALAGPVYLWLWSWFSTPYGLATAANYALAHGLAALAMARLVRGVPTAAQTAPGDGHG
jgi:hypothetical protein